MDTHKVNILEYKFQFNNDSVSCKALDTMISDLWHIEGFIIEDGYVWLILRKEEY